MSLQVIRGGNSLPSDPLILDQSQWIIHRIKFNDGVLNPVLDADIKLIDPNLKKLNDGVIATTKKKELQEFLKSKSITEHSYTIVEDHSLRFNLVNLRNRGVGTRFYRDENTGILQRLDGFFEKIWYFVNPYYRRTVDEGVAQAVSELLKHIGTVNYQQDVREEKILPGHRGILTEFFTKSKIVRLSTRLYDRSQIPKKIIQILQGVEFREKKAKRKPHKNDPGRIIGFEEEYKYRREKVKFAQSLGVELVRNKAGSSGNYTGRSWQSKLSDRNRFKPLLIIKPYDEGPDSHLNPNLVGRIKNFIWRYIPFVSRRTCYFPNHNPVQEAASSFMDKRFELGVIPFTQYEENYESRAFHGVSNKEKISKHASCTVFVKDVEEAYDVLDLIKPKWWLPFQIPLVVQRFFMGEERIRELNNKLKKDIQFDNVVIAHIAAGNGDGHPANYLIRKVSKQLVAIDFGWSFPHSHPSDYLALRFMYDFRHLPQADKSFEEETFVKIGKIKEDICLHLKCIRDHLQVMIKANHDPSSITSWPMPERPDPASQQIKCMWQRLQPLFKAYDDNLELKKCMAELEGIKESVVESDVARRTILKDNIASLKENLKISKIAEVRSQKDFEEFFQKNPKYSPNPPNLD